MPSCISQLFLRAFGVVGTIVPFLLISSERRNHGRGCFSALVKAVRDLAVACGDLAAVWCDRFSLSDSASSPSDAPGTTYYPSQHPHSHLHCPTPNDLPRYPLHHYILRSFSTVRWTHYYDLIFVYNVPMTAEQQMFLVLPCWTVIESSMLPQFTQVDSFGNVSAISDNE